MNPPEICPQCGADVPSNARACPECGSDEDTGWSEEARLGQLGIPSEEFDYDEFVREEFGGESPSPRPHGITFLWWLVAIILLVAFLSFWVL